MPVCLQMNTCIWKYYVNIGQYSVWKLVLTSRGLRFAGLTVGSLVTDRAY